MDEFALPFLTRKMLSFGDQTTFQLRLKVIGRDSAIVNVVGFTKDGHFIFQQITTGGNSPEEFDFAIADIPTFCSVILDPESGGDALTHAALSLVVNGNEMAILTQGIINENSSIGWPHVPPLTVPQQIGVVQEITLDSPLAGEEFDRTVFANEVWELHGIGFELDTDATAADRTVELQFQNTSVIFRGIAGTTQQANEVQIYNFNVGGTTRVITANEEQEISLGSVPLLLPPGTGIVTNTTNLQAGDAFSNATVRVRRWIQTD